eukprot:CAMPEP_0202030048 /NCGR_PEP_ID=MMETSP0905-20130828/64294_1 /ASSEMBLY_ACC=CAM_ASM_000554 /TAXON_ID=420261 /ORGANISM="Thalassiosira antarctica, Strain CCMP982" /LENGTH=476 /DNA_ID=CAMNT_0048593833 /DNA_START=1937 /DNA_END=3367 /DNA_ORIENTATION=+
MEGFNEHEEEGWNEEINHDDEEVADEDAEEEKVKRQIKSEEKVKRQVESDDPDLVELKIRRRGYDFSHANDDDSYFPHADDWERDGEIIGRNTHLKVLEFSTLNGGVAKEDVEKFFRGVANNRSIQKLRLYDCNLFGGELFSILIPFFKSNRNFECLEISCCVLERDGIDLLASVLVEFDSLKEFEFSSYGDELQEHIQALAGHSGLKKLILRGNSVSNLKITIAGWRTIFAFLQSPHSLLEILDLSMSGINDEVVNSLTNALVNNNKLRELDLSWNGHITATGCEAFSAVLQNPGSALEKLDLSGNSINDGTVITLATSLSNNRKLKELILESQHAITINGWAAFSRVLCNTSSIMGTFHSNHTLQKLDEYEGGLPADIRSLLRLNQENSKCQAARLKIIKTHFSGSNIDLQPFIGMELQVMPRAIAWMGRDGSGKSTTETNGRSLLYQFLRTKPELFERAAEGQHWEGLEDSSA